jgi:tetratricopeptide (TPR) repeat protein
MKHNPSFLSEEELIRSFAVRHVDLHLILDIIKENIDNSNQHVLVIAARGMGKTMLVLRVAAEVRRDKELSKRWYPLVFGEESYEVGTVGEFWLKAIYHLAKQTEDERWEKAYQQLQEEKDDKRLYEGALAALLDFADEQDKRILLIVENVDMLLGEQISADELWVLRHTLLNEARIMLLATATTHFNEINKISDALFGQFKHLDLEPLNNEEAQILWNTITDNAIEIQHIRPIQILTGGNPRLLTIISSFAAGASFRDLMSNLTHLVDEHTNYFKSNIESLPAVERKVFVALADIWEPATARAVAQEARIGVNKASSLLNRLHSRGVVMLSKEKGKKKCYQVGERLYNIYHLMRKSGRPSDRVRAVVDFMINFYEGEKLAQKIALLTEEACELDPESRKDHILAYKAIFHAVRKKEIREDIIKSTSPRFFSLLDNAGISREIKETELQLELSKTPDNAVLWERLGILREEQGSYSEAEEAYKRAIEFNPNDARGWVNLGHILEKLLSYKEAEEAFRKAIEIDPKRAWPWVSLGGLLQQLGSNKEAEEAFRKAIEIDPKHAWAWVSLGHQLEKREHNKEAEEAFRKAIEIDPKHEWAWVCLGGLLKQLGRNEEAEKAFREAIKIDPKHFWAWADLGELMEKLLRYEEAEKAFRKATEFDPKYAWARVRLGGQLEKLERYKEAEKEYLKGIEINPKDIRAWESLIVLKIKRSVPADQLFDLMTQYLKRSDRSPVNLNHVAWLIMRNNFETGLSYAEICSREAVEKTPENPDYQYTLAAILVAQGKEKESLLVAPMFLRDVGYVKRSINDVVQFFVNNAVAGFAKEGLDILKKSPSAGFIEPLIIALQIMVGEEYNAPQEVVEVARDVLKKINNMKQTKQ